MFFRFILTKTTATVNASRIAQIIRAFRDQIMHLVEVNGAGAVIVHKLQNMTETEVLSMQRAIEYLIQNEKPLASLNNEEILNRTRERCQRVTAILKGWMGIDLTGRVKPKMTAEEYEARIIYFENQIRLLKASSEPVELLRQNLKKYKKALIQLRDQSEADKNKIADLEKMVQEIRQDRQALQQSESISLVAERPQSLSDLAKEYEQAQTQLKNVEVQKSDLEAQLKNSQIKVTHLENLIQSVDNQINQIQFDNTRILKEKAVLEKKPDSEKRNERINDLLQNYQQNLERIQTLENDRRLKQSQIENFLIQQKKLISEIAKLELQLMKQYESSLLGPLFLFLTESIALSEGVKFQISLYLMRQLRRRSLTKIWHEELFPLIKKLKNSEASLVANVLTDWLKEKLNGTRLRGSQGLQGPRLEIENEQTALFVKDYFLKFKEFSLHENTVFYLLSENILFETDSVKDQLLSELLVNQSDAKLFWQACWELYVSNDSLDLKIKKYEQVWTQFGIGHTQFYLSHAGLMLLYKETPAKKLQSELSLQNYQKRQLLKNEFDPHFLKRHLNGYKETRRPFKKRLPEIIAGTGFVASQMGSAWFYFSYLNKVFYLLNVFPQAALNTITGVISAPLFLLSTYGLSRLWKMTHESPWQLFKKGLFRFHERQIYQLLEKRLKEQALSLSDFELALWQMFLNRYDHYSNVTKKLFLQWVPKNKQTAWPTISLENQELDRLVKLVVLGKTNLSEEKIFSHIHFEQARAALVLELIKDYLKNE